MRFEPSAQTRPIVCDKYRIAGVRRIVLHAGGLPRNKPFEADSPFKPGDILRRVISDTRNRITICDKVPGSQIDHRPRTGAEELSLRFARLGRMFGELNNLPFLMCPI